MYSDTSNRSIEGTIELLRSVCSILEIRILLGVSNLFTISLTLIRISCWHDFCIILEWINKFANIWLTLIRNNIIVLCCIFLNVDQVKWKFEVCHCQWFFALFLYNTVNKLYSCARNHESLIANISFYGPVITSILYISVFS